MAQIYYPSLPVFAKPICDLGGRHANMPISLVCLDTHCRDAPLACSQCFTCSHRFHKVVSLDKFVDEYSRNVTRIDRGDISNVISRHQQELSEKWAIFKETIINDLTAFEESFQYYFHYIYEQRTLLPKIQNILNISLHPDDVRSTSNLESLKESIRIILNNALFNESCKMVKTVDLFSQDGDRIRAQLDKFDAITVQCCQKIEEAIKGLRFVGDIVRAEKEKFREDVQSLNKNRNSFDSTIFYAKDVLQKTLCKFGNDSLYCSSLQIVQESSSPRSIACNPQIFEFSSFKHQSITLKHKSLITSNINALKPQYALITPHLHVEPRRIQHCSLKINNCRDLATTCTLAVGVSILPQLQSASFEGCLPHSSLLLTSKGYVIGQGKQNKTDFIFGTGDILHIKFDPYYHTLQISKNNGRKMLWQTKTLGEPLYLCTRMTYASDQIQIL